MRDNLYQMTKRSPLNTKTVGHWIAIEEKTKKSKHASKRVKFDRRCQFSEVEEEFARSIAICFNTIECCLKRIVMHILPYTQGL